MKSFVSVALAAGLVVGLPLSSFAGTEQPSDPGVPAASGADASPAAGQQRIAQTTLKLEKAFSDQFVKGQIDRDALAPLVADVVQAMPDAARPKVQSHVEQVVQAGQKLASQMTPEQRAQLAASPAADKVERAHVDLISSWGWPNSAGFGGLGAFGFPGMYYNCVPYSTGYAYPYAGVGWNGYTSGYNAARYSSLVCGGGSGYGTGYGLGLGGWYW